MAYVATRRIPSRVPKPLLRALSSVTAPPLNLTPKLAEPSTRSGSPAASSSSALDLTDSGRLFASARTGTLVAALATLSAMAIEPLVDAGTAVMRSRAIMESLLGRSVVIAAVRSTVYRHFCAGESVEEVDRAVRDLSRSGLRAILDYGMEDAEDAEACARNLAGFLRTVEMASSMPPTSATVCIKITALCPISLLERISDLLRWNKKDPSFELPWKAHSFPILTDSSPIYLTPSIPEPLTQAEELELRSVHENIATLCEQCAKYNIPLLVDAEYASVQPAIDYFTYSAALKYNRGDCAVVYGTMQAYLKDSKERLVNMVNAAEEQGFSIGLKLVRGAYLTRETQLASAFGVPSPIHGSIQETHKCYNECASFLLERVRQGSGAVVLATHNVESGRLAAAKAQELGIVKTDQKLQFAQLMGMADGLSLGLRNAGFQVSKYLPFGPVDQVIPYLLRRAEENRGFLSSAALDRQLLRKELKRRLKTAVLGRD
ncbi:proline dehydrogenase 1, mitochondrial-like [Ananas comosus]|uniref:Proline dehydrogenase n=1 Tax=Ananas comosus TaxID=4615 RepID=A0A6P5ERX7_ANACO|nr:proline dehydrogenase 1, mitochondrial-like [Ananas comosus]